MWSVIQKVPAWTTMACTGKGKMRGWMLDDGSERNREFSLDQWSFKWLLDTLMSTEERLLKIRFEKTVEN